jgi:hypothetical protein
MKYLILVLFFVAIFHFVYDGIIAPSLRVSLRPNHSIEGMPSRLRRPVTPHVKRWASC